MHTRTASIALALAALVGIAGSGHAARWKGADGYQFEGKQYTQLRPVMRFVVHPSLEDLRATAPQMGRENPKGIMAWSDITVIPNIGVPTTLPVPAVDSTVAETVPVIGTKPQPYLPPAVVCVVHIVDPTVGYYPEFIGHEVMHCIFGDWHHKFTARGPMVAPR